MAVAVDIVAGAVDNGVGSITIPAFTIGGAANAFVLAIANGQSGITVSNCSCAGVSASSIHARTINGNISIHLWGGINPATGSQTATVNYSNTWGTKLGIVAAVFSGVDTTGTPFTDYAEQTATGTAPSITVANAGSDDFVLDAIKSSVGGNWAAGANQTRQYFSDDRIAVSTQDGADGGAMDWTLEFSGAYALAGVRVVAAAGGGSTERHQTRRMIQAGGYF